MLCAFFQYYTDDTSSLDENRSRVAWRLRAFHSSPQNIWIGIALQWLCLNKVDFTDVFGVQLISGNLGMDWVSWRDVFSFHVLQVQIEVCHSPFYLKKELQNTDQRTQSLFCVKSVLFKSQKPKEKKLKRLQDDLSTLSLLAWVNACCHGLMHDC